MNLALKLASIFRIRARRIATGLRSLFWSLDLRRRGASIGKEFVVHGGAEISLAKGASLRIGRGVRLAERSRIIVSAGASLEIGDGVFLGVNSLIACGKNISLGHDSQIAHNVTVIDHDHGDLRVPDSIGKSGPIQVGPFVWIAAHAVVLKGVSLGEGSVVGAGAVVTRSTAARELTLGQGKLGHHAGPSL